MPSISQHFEAKKSSPRPRLFGVEISDGQLSEPNEDNSSSDDSEPGWYWDAILLGGLEAPANPLYVGRLLVLLFDCFLCFVQQLHDLGVFGL